VLDTQERDRLSRDGPSSRLRLNLSGIILWTGTFREMLVSERRSKPMETVVDGMVCQSAERLGLDLAHPAVTEARQTAREALSCGCAPDDAFQYARSVMIQVVRPAGWATEAA
jgi:hypothetical protein